jgi:predicted alpha/beta superfamily hydrolase
MIVRRTLRAVFSPQLRNRRDVDVYLPASYRDDGRRYPVVYMHDGQNLSDPSKAFAGTWELEGALAQLAERRVEPIVVGIHHSGRGRLAEYSPFPDRRHGGGDADAYLELVSATIKPRIDRLFRTRPEREATAIVGSSMGGLVSLYAYFRFPSIFGRAGVMSPSIWFGQGMVLDFIKDARTPPSGRIYLDVGTHEGAGTLRDARRLGQLLVQKRFTRDRRGQPRRGRSRLRYVEVAGGRHSEADWARRLPSALEFLLAD